MFGLFPIFWMSHVDVDSRCKTVGAKEKRHKWQHVTHTVKHYFTCIQFWLLCLHLWLPLSIICGFWLFLHATATCGTWPQEPHEPQGPEGGIPNRVDTKILKPGHYTILHWKWKGEMSKIWNDLIPSFLIMWWLSSKVCRDPVNPTFFFSQSSSHCSSSHKSPTELLARSLSPVSCPLHLPTLLCPPWHLCPTARPHSFSHPSPARVAEGSLCMHSLGDINPPSPHSHQTKEALTNR